MSGFVIQKHPFTPRHIEPGLYVAATPIGNLGDVTLRVLETLAACDLIACEDTRVTAKLLRHYHIKTRMISYHEHNAKLAGPKLIAALLAGKSVVLVSDAGTPLVSDPGFRLVEEARAQSIPVWPLPGPTAPVAALVASGLPAEGWLFGGFLPVKQVARRKKLDAFTSTPATLIFFESPKRVAKTLTDMVAVFGKNRDAAIARELTKLHEEIVTGTLGELVERFGNKPTRGEIVMMVAPPPGDAPSLDIETLLRELLQTMPVSRAAAEAAELTGLPRRELYAKALILRDG